MYSFLIYLKQLSLSFWLGEMLFFVIIFAPRVFKILSRESAAKLQASIFPGYFWVGFICGLILILFYLYSIFINTSATSKDYYGLALSIISCAIFAYCLFTLNPEISELQKTAINFPKDSSEQVVVDFQEKHKLSVKLNVIVLVILLVLIAL